MAERDHESIPGLVRSILDDTRDLIREELALARAEIRDEIAAAQTVGISFAAAAAAAGVGIVLLSVALGSALAYFLNWPAWTGYGIVAAVLLGGAYGLVNHGRQRLSQLRALPKTTETIKENLAWIQSKSAER